MDEQIAMTDPLLDDSIRMHYFNLQNLPQDDVRVIDARERVQAYFEAKHKDDSPGVIDVPGGTGRVQQKSASAELTEADKIAMTAPPQEEELSLIDDLRRDGYEPLLTPEFEEEARPLLAQEIVKFGDPSDAESWLSMAEHHGQERAVRAFRRLEAIQRESPGWRQDKRLRKEVVELNRVLDAGTLALISKLRA